MHRSHPRKLSQPPLMRGFGRHTSKVIAYLRDQVRPPRRSLNSSLPYRRGVSHGNKGNADPAFREVIKTVVLAEPPPLITANYPWNPPSLLHASLPVVISGHGKKTSFAWSPRPRLANSEKLIIMNSLKARWNFFSLKEDPKSLYTLLLAENETTLKKFNKSY